MRVQRRFFTCPTSSKPALLAMPELADLMTQLAAAETPG
jgi:hypothetical protein